MSRRRARPVDDRQLDLLDWLASQPAPKDKKTRLHTPSDNPDVDEDQLDLVELIMERGQAA